MTVGDDLERNKEEEGFELGDSVVKGTISELGDLRRSRVLESAMLS